MANKLSKIYILGILTQALKQGMTPRKLAVTFALGAVIGIFPIMGTSTLICLGLSIVFRLNIPVMQLANYLVTALQVICILPFIQLGGYVFGLPALSYSRDQLILLFQNDFWKLLRESGVVIAGGVGAWLIVSIPLFFALYFFFSFLFSRWKWTNPGRYEQQ
jgi:uncharacterized protein (DUF2062 family)